MNSNLTTTTFRSPKIAKQILIIEDNPTDLVWTQRILSKAGYEVLTASNGVEGIYLAHRARPDLILLDCILPDIDGTDVCRIIKNDDYAKHIPIIFLSILEDGGNLVRCYELGAEHYLTKPITAKQLISEIEFTLENR